MSQSEDAKLRAIEKLLREILEERATNKRGKKKVPGRAPSFTHRDPRNLLTR